MRGRLLIAGLGNVLMSDDAIGPYCVALLRATVEVPGNVELADLGSPGLDLALHLSTADRVIAVDALRGVEPGSLHVLNRRGGLSSRHDVRLNTHAPSLEESIQIARLSAERPHDVTLVGLGGACFDHGTGLSSIVRAQMTALADLVLARLTRLGVPWHRRHTPAALDTWWDRSGDVFVRKVS